MAADEPIWLREARVEEPVRGLTRARIVAQAIAVADAEGLSAVSIRRVAGELGVRPMSLYDHFQTKEDLVDLMRDEVARESLIDPAALPAEWDQALRMLARQSRAAVLRHPWMVATLGRGSRLSPAILQHLDQSVLAASSLGADQELRAAVIRAVDTFTLGHVIAEAAGGSFGGQDEPGRRAAEIAYVQGKIDRGELPHLAEAGLGEMFGNGDPDATFERGLDWLLAGVAASLG